jgi:hypothetical protein
VLPPYRDVRRHLLDVASGGIVAVHLTGLELGVGEARNALTSKGLGQPIVPQNFQLSVLNLAR